MLDSFCIGPHAAQWLWDCAGPKSQVYFPKYIISVMRGRKLFKSKHVLSVLEVLAKIGARDQN